MITTVDDIRAARQRIGPRAHRTPTMTATTLGQRVGLGSGELLVKAELFQKTGSFKVRGVFNKLLSMPESALRSGVVSLSAGNHAAALAYGATAVGTSAVIVMPAGAAPSKIEATRAYGGEVVLTEGSLLDTCLEIQAARALELVHPFDDPLIIAGQGTVGLELVEDTPDVDLVVVPVGGGGLISGVAAAVKALNPATRVVGVEPEGAAAMTASLAAGKPVHIDAPASVADGLAAPFAGEHTLAHVQALVDEVVVVSDDVIVEALRLVMSRTKLAVEPAAAAAIAPFLAGAIQIAPGQRTVAVLSGGNVDHQRLAAMLAG